MLAAIKKALRHTPEGRENTPRFHYTSGKAEAAIQRWLDEVLQEAKKGGAKNAV